MMRGEIEEGERDKQKDNNNKKSLNLIPPPSGRLGRVKLQKIMKKKYIKPEIQVVEVELEMIAASMDQVGIYDDQVDTGLAKGHDGSFDVWGLDEE